MAKVPQSIVVGALLVFANAAQARADGALEDAQLNAAVAVESDKGDFEALEKLVLATAHGRTLRENGRLTLFFDNDGRLTLEDREGVSSPLGNRDSYVRYYLLADLPSHNAFVVLVEGRGRHEVRIIDDRAGRQTVLPAVPQFGAHGGEFITLDDHIRNDKSDITIWQWRGGAAQAVWRHGRELDPIHHATALVRWADPDAIHLDLWCASGPHWPATVLRGREGWRLDVIWPELNPRTCGNPPP